MKLFLLYDLLFHTQKWQWNENENDAFASLRPLYTYSYIGS